jgi:hypothetical protein
MLETEEGWIKLNRSLLKWEWADDPNTLSVWIHILLGCSYEAHKWHGIDIPVGGFLTSLASLSNKTGLSVMQVRTAIDHLIATQCITKKTTKKYTLLIVNNWDKYQSGNKVGNNEITKWQQSDNKVVTTFNKVNKGNNVKEGEEIKNISASSSNPAKDSGSAYGKTSFSVDDFFASQISNPDLLDALNSFAASRKAKKNPIATKRAAQKLLNRLNELAPYSDSRKIEIVDQSAVNGWADFFPLREMKSSDTRSEYAKRNGHKDPEWLEQHWPYDPKKGNLG